MSISAACFSNGTYTGESFAKCVSNLLAIGFKKFVLDLYWNQAQLYWSLCPVELPLPTSTSQSVSATSSATSSTQDASGTALSERNAAATAITTLNGSTTTVVPKARSVVTGDSSLLDVRQVGAAQLPNEQPYVVGSYTCDVAANITTVVSVFSSYMHVTDTTLAASLKEITFNLHVASPSEDPGASARQPPNSRLPLTGNLIGSIFNANLSTYIYSPGSLSSQRADLNTSWSAAPSQDAPDSVYFTNITQSGRNSTSPDGWPSEGFMEFYKQSRLVLNFGTVDPQISNYNLQADSEFIFPAGSLNRAIQPTLASNGTVSDGCIFDPSHASVSSANSSWATADIDEFTVSSASILTAANSLTACGISPLLNTSLANVSAGTNSTPYFDYFLSAVWSWAPNQPLNDSFAQNATFPGQSDITEPNTNFRCAYLNATASSSPGGRWATTFCQFDLAGACRDNHNPYLWSITPQRGTYGTVANGCPANTSIAVPRTALENRYLAAAAQDHFSDPRYRSGNDAPTSGLVWINYNSLNVESCWVSGVNSTCPYSPNANQTEGQVVVPTVAAIAIIVLAVLTILVKCGANRRSSRKRRRVRDGWEYEGVPS